MGDLPANIFARFMGMPALRLGNVTIDQAALDAVMSITSLSTLYSHARTAGFVDTTQPCTRAAVQGAGRVCTTRSRNNPGSDFGAQAIDITVCGPLLAHTPTLRYSGICLQQFLCSVLEASLLKGTIPDFLWRMTALIYLYAP
jgi:hypothetical protein